MQPRNLEHSLWTVLLVDDEPLLTEALRRSLRQQPYRILTAPSAEDALLILADESVDVIVSDYHMPGMNGIQLLKQVAQQFPNVTQILLSGDSGEPCSSRDLRSVPIFRVLAKPCRLQDLAQAIHDGLSQCVRE